MTGARPAAVARRLLWRLAFALAGGLRVTGPVPTGPAVVVANHTSHADTAALLAALPARVRPRAAAAADYWFDVPWRRAVITGLVGALPVRRDAAGGYEALLRAARPHLEAGGVVIVYPEGTRTRDGSIGRFRSGALRLARDTGVPVVAAAIAGTGDVLPKSGRFSPAPVEVRFTPAADPRTLEAPELRDRVLAELARGPARPRTSRAWRAAARFAAGPALLLAAFCWGFAEALSWPVIAEMFLVLGALAVPRRVLPAAAVLAAGSVTGVVVHAWLAGRGVQLPAPLTTEAMHAAAGEHLAAGPGGLFHQALGGIPVKVYAAQAGSAGLDLTGFAAAAALERPLRILTVGAVLAVAARLAHPWLRRLYGTYLVAAVLTFVAAFSAVLAHWS